MALVGGAVGSEGLDGRRRFAREEGANLKVHEGLELWGLIVCNCNVCLLVHVLKSPEHRSTLSQLVNSHFISQKSPELFLSLITSIPPLFIFIIIITTTICSLNV